MTKERSIADLAADESAAVARVACGGEMLRRLLDLGLVAGTRVTALFRGPAGDPTAYFFRGAVIALRACDAKNIFVEKG